MVIDEQVRVAHARVVIVSKESISHIVSSRHVIVDDEGCRGEP